MGFQMPKSKAVGYAVLVLGAIIWGTEGVLAKLCYVSGFSVAGLLGLRYVVAVIVFVLLALCFKAPLLPPKHLRLKTLAIGILGAIGSLCLYIAIDALPPTLAILFFYAFPALTSMISAATGRQPFDAPHIVALLLSAGGLVLLYWSSMTFVSVLGITAALLSALFQSVKLIASSDLLEQMDIWTFNLALAVVAVVGYNLLAALGLLGGYTLDVAPVGWLGMLILGMVVTVFGNLFMFMGVNIVGAVDTAIVNLLEPPTTALLAFVVFGDVLSGWQWVGAALVLLAVALPPFINLRLVRKASPLLEEKDEIPTTLRR